MPTDRFCIKCRYNLKGLSEHRCPECGMVFDPQDPFSFAISSISLYPIQILIGAALLVVVIAWAAFGSGDFTMFIDLNSLIWVVGIVIAGLWMCFGPITATKAIIGALRGSRPDDEGKFTIGIAVLARGYQLAWAAGLSGTLVGLIIMLSNMDDPAALGPGLAVSLLTAIYGLILAEFIFSPLQQVLISRASVPMDTVPWLTLPQRSMLLLCVAGVLLLGSAFVILFVTLGP